LFNYCESVSQVVDDALKSAAEVLVKTSKEADKKFKRAIDALRDYEKRYHFETTMAESMAAEEAKDKSSTNLKDRSPVRGSQVSLEVTFASYLRVQAGVEFRIHRSLLDRNPIIVKREPAYRCGLQY
jgi:hypothetical protein